MKALITGASSGIGRDMARYLAKLGYDLVIVARRKDLLEQLKKELPTNVKVECVDLANSENCKQLFEANREVDILVNNAGFGDFGKFEETDLEKELAMIDTNIKSLHILTKLYLSEMKKKNSGHILNVASIAGFMPGPLMAEYYASKNFVLSYTKAIYTELKKEGSEVHISALCPGPTKTNFNKVANVDFKMKSYSAEYVAEYGINKMFEEKLVIVPGIKMKLTHMASRILPSKLMSNFAYERQKRKRR